MAWRRSMSSRPAVGVVVTALFTIASVVAPGIPDDYRLPAFIGTLILLVAACIWWLLTPKPKEPKPEISAVGQNVSGNVASAGRDVHQNIYHGVQATPRKIDDDYYRHEFVTKFMQGVLAPSEHAIATSDSRTKESAFLVAKLIDDFLIRLANAPADRRSFDMFRDDYRKVEVELRQLKLRNATRPLNSISTAQVEIMFRMWHRFKEHHQKKDNVSPVFIQEWQKQVADGLSQILELEERKPKAKR